MILTYDSILGIPITESSDNNTSNSNTNKSISPFMIIILGIVLALFIVVFSTLGKNSNEIVSTTESNSSIKFLTILTVGMFILVILLNGLQYFLNINLTARLDNLFTDTPSLDLTVEEETNVNDPSSIPPVPEIQLKKQVFHIPGNKYNYENATALCKAYGSRLATYNEIETAYKNGAEWCSYGWSDRQLALFPTQKKTWNYLQTVEGHENDCGRAGINGGYIANENVRFGANCYGYKPKITDDEKEIMETKPLYPKTMEDVREENRVEFWRRRIPEILVAPFNNNVWSLL